MNVTLANTPPLPEASFSVSSPRLQEGSGGTVDPMAQDRYVVSYGKGGAVGIFTSAEPLHLRRGQNVVVQTHRGVEFGGVLCAANDRQAILLGAAPAGRLLRRVNAADEMRRREQAAVQQQIFETSRVASAEGALALEVLDVDLLFDAVTAIVQFVGSEADAEILAHRLEERFGLTLRLENLALATPHEEEVHGCDKPDCGRTAGGGGCTTCSTGGGCSSCGSSKVDLRQYFGHLRTKMEEQHRTPLAQS